jgi:hypothetical protein
MTEFSEGQRKLKGGKMRTLLLIVAAVLVVQVVLVMGYLAVAQRSGKRSGFVGSVLAVLLVAMWVGVLTLLPTE